MNVVVIVGELEGSIEIQEELSKEGVLLLSETKYPIIWDVEEPVKVIGIFKLEVVVDPLFKTKDPVGDSLLSVKVMELSGEIFPHVSLNQP